MMAVAEVSWSEDGQPHSVAFDDVYFSRAGGTAECEAVFLAGNGLPQAWQELTRFTIGETGFGSGLNLLTTCHHFSQTTTNECLRFVSVEKHPLSLADMRKVHALLPEHLHPWAQRLHSLLPPALTGWHYFSLSERIEVWLYFGDVMAGLSDLDNNLAVNAWFLDGFSPAKNPQMWSQGVFFQLSRLSAPRATLATFTAASAVRKGLTLAGFEVTKTAGFGQKRERIIAVHQQYGKFQRNHHKTYLPLARESLTAGSSVAIIGAGIAGATIAHQLAQAGMLVTVYEQNSAPAQAASGNLAGIVMPVLDRQQGFYAQWYWQAWQETIRWLSAQEDDRLGCVSGVFTWQQQAQRQQELAQWVNDLQMPHWLQNLTEEDTLSQFGSRLPSGIYVAQAGWLSPIRVVNRLLDHANIRLHNNTRVTALQHATETWHVTRQTADQTLTDAHTAVVVACGAGIDQLLPEWAQYLSKQKGQVTHLPESLWQGNVPTMPWMFDGYVMPAVEGKICVGATFEKDAPLGITPEGIAHNLHTLAQAIPTQQNTANTSFTGHSAYRMMTKDHLPLVGSLVNVDRYQQGISDCVARPDTCPDMTYARLSRCYVSIGHGARGLSSAFLSARVIRAMITDESLPLSIRLLQAVHPARIIFREMHTLDAHFSRI